jgi:DNA-binding MarR family transcriptional regulator
VVEDTLFEGLVRLSFLVQQLLTAVAQDHRVTVQQLRLLAILSDREPTMAHLAVLMGLERSSLSGLVDRAQRAGLVRRTGATHDRRAVRVTLTDTGHDLHTTLHAAATEQLRSLTTALDSPDREHLATLLRAVVTPPS